MSIKVFDTLLPSLVFTRVIQPNKRKVRTDFYEVVKHSGDYDFYGDSPKHQCGQLVLIITQLVQLHHLSALFHCDKCIWIWKAQLLMNQYHGQELRHDDKRTAQGMGPITFEPSIS